MATLYALEEHPISWGNGGNAALKQWEDNALALEQQDREARTNHKLVGRTVRHGFADGYAIYQVIKENPKSVRIRVCTGLGDDWVLPAWGAESTLTKDALFRFIRR